MVGDEVCTFFATGSCPVFQPIYICKTCCPCSFETPNITACICEACSQHCHATLGHEIDFVGVGPCFCDCSKISITSQDLCKSPCTLEHVSKQAAMSLGISSSTFNGLNVSLPPPPSRKPVMDNMAQVENPQPEQKPHAHVIEEFPFHIGSFILPIIRDNNPLRSCLKYESLELVKHTTDTHWLPRQYLIHEPTDLSQLELLALKIFQYHVMSNHLSEFLSEESGCEWWIQIKDIQKNEALDLHYDKDEELASVFSLGSFPTLSTVTYFTDGYISNDPYSACTLPISPTIVFAHTYDMSTEEGEMCVPDQIIDNKSSTTRISYPQVFISHPRVGKHIIFDGKLLHGAPNEPLLQESLQKSGSQVSSVVPNEPLSQLRITFLVNIWLSRRPSKVAILSPLIRQRIIQTHESINISEKLLGGKIPRIEFVDQPIDKVSLCKESYDIFPDPITLPFVSQGATWIDYNEDDLEENLIVCMFPPINSFNTHDSVVICYGDELKPSFENPADNEGLLCQEIADDVEYEEDYV